MQNSTIAPVVRLACLACLGLLSGCAAFHRIEGVPARYLAPELRAESRSHGSTIDLSLLAQNAPNQHYVDGGDVLGIYIEGVLGSIGEAPPISVPSSPDLPPSIGYPITVRDDGTLSLPMIGSIPVRGMTIRQVEELLRRIYTIDRKILQPGQDRIIVSLQRPRQVKVLVLRQEAGGPGGTEFAQGLSLNLGQTKRGNGQLIHLPIYKNDVLHALARTGGLPGLDAENTIYVIRRKGRGGMMGCSPGPLHSPPAQAPGYHVPVYQPSLSQKSKTNQIQLVAYQQSRTPVAQQVTPVTNFQSGIRNFSSSDPLAELRAGMHNDSETPLRSPALLDTPLELRAQANIELSEQERNMLRPGASSYQWGNSGPGMAPENNVQPPAQPNVQHFAPKQNTQPEIEVAPMPNQAPQDTPQMRQQQQLPPAQNWQAPPVQNYQQQPYQHMSPPAALAPQTTPGWNQQPMMAPQVQTPDSFASIPWEQFANEVGWNVGDPTMNNREIIKIPVRLKPGEQPNICQRDVILEDGDIVFIESRETEIFYTGGLLGGGQYTLPRDYDLDVLGAIAIAQGSANSQSTGRQIGGVSAFNGDVTISASKIIILRQLPNGGQVPINVDLYRAIKDPAERILIQPGDIVMLRYKPMEAVGAFLERNLLESALFGVAASQLTSGN